MTSVAHRSRPVWPIHDRPFDETDSGGRYLRLLGRHECSFRPVNVGVNRRVNGDVDDALFTRLFTPRSQARLYTYMR